MLITPRASADTPIAKTPLDHLPSHANETIFNLRQNVATTPATKACGRAAVRPTEIDLRKVPAVLYRNGVIEESGVSAAVLNHPAKGVAWLANKLAPYDVTLQPGQIILGGSFTRPVAARPGDTFHVDYDMLGSIACRFV